MIACPNCRTIQPASKINTGELYPCPQCRVRIRADVFNAFHRPVSQGPPGHAVHEQGQAECFYHPGKQAVAPCSACGRLLCALCEVELDGSIFCLSCLQAGRDKQKITTIENQRPLYDSMALALALWPMLFIFPTLLTAPAAIYFAIRYWRTPTSILPRTKIRHILALLLAGGQIVGWVIFFAALFSR